MAKPNKVSLSRRLTNGDAALPRIASPLASLRPSAERADALKTAAATDFAIWQLMDSRAFRRAGLRIPPDSKAAWQHGEVRGRQSCCRLRKPVWINSGMVTCLS